MQINPRPICGVHVAYFLLRPGAPSRVAASARRDVRRFTDFQSHKKRRKKKKKKKKKMQRCRRRRRKRARNLKLCGRREGPVGPDATWRRQPLINNASDSVSTLTLIIPSIICNSVYNHSRNDQEIRSTVFRITSRSHSETYLELSRYLALICCNWSRR